MRIEPVAPEAYARTVLPQTHALWGGGRSLDQYARDFLAFAGSRYALRRFRTIAFVHDGAHGATCKVY